MPPLARSGLTAVPPRLWGDFFNPLTKCSSVRVYFRGESRRFELRRVFSGGTIVFWEKKGFPPFLDKTAGISAVWYRRVRGPDTTVTNSLFRWLVACVRVFSGGLGPKLFLFVESNSH